jgi:aquaporin Z
MANPDKYLAEFLGTMLLLICILASSGNSLIVGAALAVAVYFSASISGGHINPAVSLAMYINNKLSLKDLLTYVAVQLAGGVSAVFLYKAVLTL